jgi:hypothetical protein
MDTMERDAPVIGSGAHRYRFVRNWARLPRGWLFRDADPKAKPPRMVSKGAVAANGEVVVLSRSAHPVVPDASSIGVGQPTIQSCALPSRHEPILRRRRWKANFWQTARGPPRSIVDRRLSTGRTAGNPAPFDLDQCRPSVEVAVCASNIVMQSSAGGDHGK